MLVTRRSTINPRRAHQKNQHSRQIIFCAAISVLSVMITGIQPVPIPTMRAHFKAPVLAMAPRLDRADSWAGYEVDALPPIPITAVHAQWIVPSVVCPRFQKGIAATVEWVGIDGWNGYTVEQAGTGTECINGSPAYGAWVEFFGTGQSQITLDQSTYPVAPGNYVGASVTAPKKVGGSWIVNIQNSTKGWNYQTSVNIKGVKFAQRTAEWIVERPSPFTTPRSHFPLAAFSEVSFFNASLTESGVVRPLGACKNAMPITMVTKSGHLLARPSVIDHKTSAFNVKL